MYYNITIVVINYQYQNKKTKNHLRSNIAKGWKKLKRKRKPSKEAFEKQGQLEEAFKKP